MKDLFKNKEFRKFLPIFLIILALIILMSSSYALLKSSHTGTKTYTMNVGLLEVSFYNTETDNNLQITDAVPIPDSEGMAQSDDDDLVFTVKNTGTMKAVYNVYIEEISTSPAFKTVIRYIDKKDSGNWTNPKTLSVDKYIDRLSTLEVGETATYRVKAWLDESATKTYMNKTFKARIVVEALQDMGTSILNSIYYLKSGCSTKVEEDGITYISGTKECIDFNYVWYSGKMWRITAIYPDGTMKMVTDNNITSIAFNESDNVTYYDKSTSAKSYMYEWLNEDFLDTLYNYENIIVHDVNTYWNATMPETTDMSSKPAETDATMIPTSISPVGLLNSYEYYMAYQNASASTNYLHIADCWWLLNPYSSSSVRYVASDGDGSGTSPTYRSGARPSIILQSNISFTGSGTKTDPYKIVGDMSSPTLGTTKVNERVFERNSETYSYNGEYVKIKYNNSLSPLYRIVGVEEDPNDSTKKITKLVAVDYVDNQAKKRFGTSSGTIYGSGDTVDSNKTTWYSYLNGTGNNDGWFDSLSYKTLLTSGRYYMGNGDTASQYYYKGAICITSDITSPTRSCTKTTNTGVFNVGLLRYGEMFATSSKLGGGTSGMWLITKYDSSSVLFYDDFFHVVSPSGPRNTYGARPSIYLKSDVKFLTCSSSKCDGTEDYPYEVGL